MAINSQMQQQIKDMEREIDRAKHQSNQSQELETLREQLDVTQQSLEDQKSELFNKF